MAAALSGCGYFTDNWPVIQQDPIPESKDDTETPEAPTVDTATADEAELTARLPDFRARYERLSALAEDQLAAIEPTPATPDAWGVAQLQASRLVRSESDLRRLAEEVAQARHGLADSDLRARYDSLLSAVRDLADSVSAERQALERRLAEAGRPEDQKSDAPALPTGRPALTISPDAESAAYSQAVTTLVERAQAINPLTVYHLVLAPGRLAAERADSVTSLLRAAGVAETRIRRSTDPAGVAGTLRLYVEQP